MSAKEEPSFYEVLGVDQEATDTQIKAAYRRAIREAHPDLAGTADVAAQVNAAWDTLSTPSKRAEYDRVLAYAQAQKSASDSSGETDFADGDEASEPEPTWGEETIWVSKPEAQDARGATTPGAPLGAKRPAREVVTPALGLWGTFALGTAALLALCVPLSIFIIADRSWFTFVALALAVAPVIWRAKRAVARTYLSAFAFSIPWWGLVSWSVRSHLPSAAAPQLVFALFALTWLAAYCFASGRAQWDAEQAAGNQYFFSQDLAANYRTFGPLADEARQVAALCSTLPGLRFFASDYEFPMVAVCENTGFLFGFPHLTAQKYVWHEGSLWALRDGQLLGSPVHVPFDQGVWKKRLKAGRLHVVLLVPDGTEIVGFAPSGIHTPTFGEVSSNISALLGRKVRPGAKVRVSRSHLAHVWQQV